MSFATKPEDLEKFIGLSGEGTDSATIDEFIFLEKTCLKYNSIPVLVIDAEGEIVCIAPKEIAELIASLLNSSDKID